ncbi:type II toxin-antitoxin system ParD family antitoxin [Methylobacterium sp. DB0501]|nr:type II toxin-antitoxin system ParD family antitoxin [Methylobacterium sp. DB0501]
MQAAEAISITITSEQRRAVRESVASGEDASTSDVVRDAVRLWPRRRREDAERPDVTRARIRHSLDDPRPDLTGEDVQAHPEALYRSDDPVVEG